VSRAFIEQNAKGPLVLTTKAFMKVLQKPPADVRAARPAMFEPKGTGRSLLARKQESPVIICVEHAPRGRKKAV
jgi:hypothetical protein